MAIRLPARAWPLATLFIVTLANPGLALAAEAPAPSASATTDETQPKPGEITVLEKFVASERTFDLDNVIPIKPVESVFGFAKPLVETPRSATLLSSELLDKVGLRNIEDVARLVPSTYSTFRWGVQGGINVRNVSSDNYFRGMRRIDPQGNIRTVLGAFDQLEIVRGPPSPIFGNGKIGGYVNYVPRTARANTGKYLERPVGQTTFSTGSFGRAEFTFEGGGGTQILNRQAGGYIFALVNNSGSYYQRNFARDHVLQATFTIDLTRDLRMESGIFYQRGKGAGSSGINRITQQLIDDGLYWSGRPLVNLDLDSNGLISERETDVASRPVGTRSSTNLPLSRQFGGATGVTGPLTTVPTGMAPGFAMDPSTMKLVPFDWTRSAIEELFKVRTYTYFTDIINDYNPDFKYKYQFLFDTQVQSKVSRLPFTQKQNPTTWEHKITVEKVFHPKWDWLKAAWIGEANWRNVDTLIKSANGDFDDRIDLMGDIYGKAGYDNFNYALEDSSYESGMPWATHRLSRYHEGGVGMLIDLKFFNRLSFTGGARYDNIRGETWEPSRFNRNTATYTTPVYARGSDDGPSGSVSFSYKAPFGLNPYITVSRQAALTSGASALDLTPASINTGALETSDLIEGGIKASYLDNKLFVAVAMYEQSRASYSEVLGDTVLSATVGRGTEVELRFVPNKKFSLTLGGNWSQTHYRPNGFRGPTGTIITRSYGAIPETIGFKDVVDSTGKVILPAGAFVWGGNVSMAIAPGTGDYSEAGGYPDHVLTQFATYRFNNGLGFGFGTTYISDFYGSALKQIHFPSALVFNLSPFYETKKWGIKMNVFNLSNERYFTANGGDTRIQVNLPRRWDVTLTRKF